MKSAIRRSDPGFFENVLTFLDLDAIFPIRAKFLRSLNGLIRKRNSIERNPSLSAEEKEKELEELKLCVDDSHSCSLDDLGLTFQLNPSSSVYGFAHVNLIEGTICISV